MDRGFALGVNWSCSAAPGLDVLLALKEQLHPGSEERAVPSLS